MDHAVRQSVPGSRLSEDQKQIWLGRLRHGLARAYEKLGDKDNARKAYRAVLDWQQNSLERALAYPEAKRKLEA